MVLHMLLIIDQPDISFFRSFTLFAIYLQSTISGFFILRLVGFLRLNVLGLNLL